MVEDDPSTRRSVELALRADGYACDIAGLGEDGIRLGERNLYDLLILDLMLPDIVGYEVLRRLRASGVTTPVLILSSLWEKDAKIKGLNFGADDYLAKPFDYRELLARIRAILRRAKVQSETVLQAGRLAVNIATRTATIDHQVVKFSELEFRLVEQLALRKGNTLTKEMLHAHLYRGREKPDSNAVNVFICSIRKKLAATSSGEAFIHTVWGEGFVLRESYAVRALRTRAAA